MLDSIENQVSVLSADRVSKSFGTIPVLFSVSFDIVAGEVHALIGENGAGKSTLMKTLAGFHQPTSGSIKLDGKTIDLPANGQSTPARRPAAILTA